MRKLIPTLLALPLMLPSAAYPLGLGDIRLHSALNQRFSGEIELLSVRESEADSLEVSLGSHETFARLGVDRVAALNDLEFEVSERPGGRYVVEVTSEQPIREPFLDFLIEVNWSSGRMLREYTVLLDPPELMKEKAPAVTAPSTGAQADSQPRPDATNRTAVSSRQPATSAAAPSTGVRTHRVGRAETLWSIAKGMRPDRSTTVPQVMMALLKANPEAFYDNNIHRLKEGAVLRLDPALIGEMGRAAAQRELNRQTRAWEDYKARAAGQAKARPAAGSPEKPVKSVASAEESRLKLVSPEKGEPASKNEAASSAPGAEGETAELREELMLALEQAEAQRQENAELRGRLQKLEEQLASMQRLLSLKDDDLAALQGQLSGEESQAAAKQAQPPQSAPASESAAEGEGTGTESLQPEQPGDTGKPAVDTEAKSEPKAAPVVVPPQPEPSLLEQAKGTGKRIISSVTNNPVVGGLLAAAVLALLTLVLLIIRRRRQGGGFQESILTAGETSSLLRAKQAEGQASEETSFFSDFAVSGMGDIQTEDSEVDPLTEADVYMAYGRFQQAEELLKEAVKQNPESAEVQAKLLELYYKTKNRHAFELQAVEAQTRLNKAGLWNKALAMGHELAPDNPMFSYAPEGVSLEGESDKPEVSQEEVLDIGLDLDALAEEMESPADPASDNPGDFNLDLGVDFSDLEETAETGKSEKAEAGESARGGVELGLDDAPGTQQEPTEGQALDFELDGLDLDTGSADTDEAAQAPNSEIADLDLEELSLNNQAESETADAEAESPAGGEVGAGDAAEANKPSGDGANEEILDLGDLELADSSEAASTSGDASGGELADLDLGELDLGATPASADDDSAAADGGAVEGQAEDRGVDLDGLDLADLDLADSTTATAPAPEAGGEESAEAGQTEDSGFNLDGLELDERDLADTSTDAGAGGSADVDEEGASAAGEPQVADVDSPAASQAADSDDELSNFDFGDLDLGAETEESEAGSKTGAESGAPAADDFDLADLDLGDLGELGELGEDEEDDDGLFGEMDEIGTKLDLAKAYVDMGDAEGARSILEEVLQDGDEEQKGQAEALMKQIA